MFKKISFSLYILALLVLLPLASSECTMDDFLRCDREIQSKYLRKMPKIDTLDALEDEMTSILNTL